MDKIWGMATGNLTWHGNNLWETVNGTVVRIFVLPADFAAPIAPAVPAAPWPIPPPTPWATIILALVITSIVCGILIWNYGYRR